MGEKSESKLNYSELLFIEWILDQGSAVSKEQIKESQKNKRVDLKDLLNRGLISVSNKPSHTQYKVTEKGEAMYRTASEGLSKTIAPIRDYVADINHRIMQPVLDSIDTVPLWNNSAYQALMKENVKSYEILASNVTQGMREALAPLLETRRQFDQSFSFPTDAYRSLLKNIQLPTVDISGIFESLFKGWYFALKERGIEGCITIVGTEGVPLIGACLPDISKLLADAHTQEEREKILYDYEESILDFCSAIARKNPGSDGVLLSKAVELYCFREYIAAQAVAGVMMDPLVERHASLLVDKDHEFLIDNRSAKAFITLSEDRWNENNKYPQTVEERFLEQSVVSALLFALFMSTHKFYKFGQSPTPQVFNRHATVHSGDETHFTRMNALKGIMAVSSALWGFEQPVASEMEKEIKCT